MSGIARFEVGREYLGDADGEFNDARLRWRCVRRTDKFAVFEIDGRADTRRRMKVRHHRGSEWVFDTGGSLSLMASDRSEEKGGAE